MENHPIPQDVTGFQFKLIGSMTVKQFGYVAAGAVLAVIFYYAPLFFLLKYTLVIICFCLAFCLAFVPYEGRPIDLMVRHFVHALFVPNQYLYHHEGQQLPISLYLANRPTVKSKNVSLSPTPPVKQTRDKQKEKEEKLRRYLGSLPHQQNNQLDNKELQLLKSIFASFSTGPTFKVEEASETQTTPILLERPTVASFDVMMPQIISQKVKNEKPIPVAHTTNQASIKEMIRIEAERLAKEMARQQQLEAQQKALENQAKIDKSQHLEKQLQETNLQKSEFEKQLAKAAQEKDLLQQKLLRLQQQFANQQQQVYAPSMAQASQTTNLVKKIPTSMARQTGLPNVPQNPNLLVGIVKDPRGNVLPGILVEVQDKEGNPIRAFKTNNLGQFAAATPLNNGIYTITFEDNKKQHQFDRVEIEAKGAIIYPLEVISHDAREALAKELFS